MNEIYPTKLTTCPAVSPPCETRLTIGNKSIAKKVKNYVEKEFPPSTFHMQCYSRARHNPNNCYFIRDWGVLRPDGQLLLPHVINCKNIWDIYFALSFGYQYQVYYNSIGNGFTQESRDRIVYDSYSQNYPTIIGRTCIEGGNVFVFNGRDGKPRAIIGENTEVLSFIALMEQNYFKEKSEVLNKLKASIDEPSDEFIQKARHYLLLTGTELNFEKCENGPLNPASGLTDAFLLYEARAEYEPLLLSPLSAEDRVSFREQAIELQARFEMTRDLIAEDLMVKREHLAIFKGQDQQFHIDFLLSVDEEAGIVYMQGNEETIKALIDAITTTIAVQAPNVNKKIIEGIIKDRIEAIAIRSPWTDEEKLRAIVKSIIDAVAVQSPKIDKKRLEREIAKYLRYYHFARLIENPLENTNKRIIQEATGFQVALLPGMFDFFKNEDDYEIGREIDRHNEPIVHNFFNGIYLLSPNAKVFLTNAGDRVLQRIFREAMRKVNPSLTVKFLEGMHEKLTCDGGGLRCLTLNTNIYNLRK